MKVQFKKRISLLIIMFGIAVSSLGVTQAVYAKANTSDSRVHFTFRWYSPYDYTTARRKQNRSYMYMHLLKKDDGGKFNVWAEADKNVHSGGRDWHNVSGGGTHEGTVHPGHTYLFSNTAVEDYGRNVPVRFGGYSRSSDSFSTDWSPDSVKPKGNYTIY
ncbi:MULTISPECIES: hypothetical protein [Bacillus]|uniref:hypothetical protein n=1 Tax=Bacillus TaxID=1386 RepID=UPI00049AE86F|nr:hypothetical protein [Bacillus subtilis]AID00047.1 hypothetical protein Q433_20605 [Bacillus subtilis subsp. subtilis str. OH 131.1]AOA56530.1 hypothetical protein BSHJ0_03987 [Bacillus subtilis]AYK60998.1 hypothetical protein D9C14_06220 [Bacillus subtilis subsp. subtilis]MCY8982472.1 hypothetical protein [Bacillus subtilis]MDR4182661.1 hypothetical protein [Bacillus subtilis]